MLRKLSWVDHKSPRLKLQVEGIEIEVLILGKEVRGDDASLNVLIQIGFEAHLPHTLNEDISVVLVPREPSLHATLGLVLYHGLVEGQQSVGRRGETELLRLLQTLPLRVQVKA